jgi:hypothetical protein
VIQLGFELGAFGFELGFFGGDFAPFRQKLILGLLQFVLGPFLFVGEGGQLLFGFALLLGKLVELRFDFFDFLQVAALGELFALAGDQHIQVGVEPFGQFQPQEGPHGLHHATR